MALTILCAVGATVPPAIFTQTTLPPRTRQLSYPPRVRGGGRVSGGMCGGRETRITCAATMPLRIAWLDETSHPSVEYYDALSTHLRTLGHSVEVRRPPFRRGDMGNGPPRGQPVPFREIENEAQQFDVVVASFSWMNDESPGKSIRKLPAWRNGTGAFCGCTPPLVVLLNKEYTKLTMKLAWLREHCVIAALTAHHDHVKFSKETGVPFTRISFAAEPHLFGGSRLANSNHSYTHDIGFSGVLREDQTGNMRSMIWDRGFKRLRSLVRVWWGGRGSVHHGVDFKHLNQSEYAAAMRGSKLWLSTTGPADLVGQRFFEIMSTGTTLCITNRLNYSMAYSSLGIIEGVHVLMFSSVDEFVDLVVNYTQQNEYESRRLALVRSACVLARNYTWRRQAQILEDVLVTSASAAAERELVKYRRATKRRRALDAFQAPWC